MPVWVKHEVYPALKRKSIHQFTSDYSGLYFSPLYSTNHIRPVRGHGDQIIDYIVYGVAFQLCTCPPLIETSPQLTGQYFPRDRSIQPTFETRTELVRQLPQYCVRLLMLLLIPYNTITACIHEFDQIVLAIMMTGGTI